MTWQARGMSSLGVGRRGLAGVLVVLGVVFAVVTMHAMSAPGSHLHLSADATAPVSVAAPHETAASHSTGHVASSHAASSHAATSHLPASHAAGMAETAVEGHVSPAREGGSSVAMSAMCLMVLVALVVLAAPAMRALSVWLPLVGGAVAGVHSRAGTPARAPCLTVLGISRT